ncbi:MAG: YCF48-related protein [Bacteroidales bacterium]
MKKVVLFFIAFSIVKITYSQWLSQTSNTVSNLNSVCFLNADTGFTVGQSGTILKTTNGGNDWTVLPSLTTNKLNSICFANSDVGYIVGDSGIILKTITGGNDWLIIQNGTNIYDAYCSVYFINQDTGFIAESYYEAGYILKTINGGNSWTSIPCGASLSSVKSLHFYGSTIGIAVGYSYSIGSFILKTINCGDNWELTNLNSPQLKSVYIAKDTSIYIVGENNTIKKSTNGGDSWSNQYSSTNVVLNSIYFPASDTGYIAGNNGTILKTTNGGNNWNIQTNGTTNHLQSIYFIDANTGFAVGDSGTILKTTNGGINTNVENDKIRKTDIAIYPNPTNDKIEIETPKKVNIEIINAQGQIIEKVKTLNIKTMVDLTKYSSGVYIIKAKADKEIIVKKFIKQ